MELAGKRNSKRKIAINAVIILIIALITLGLEIRAMSPIIDKVCSDAAKTKATLISNNKATEVMANYTYEDFVKINKDSNGNISMLQSNIITINEITSDVAAKIQQELMEDNQSTMRIKLGSLTGIRVLAGLGPEINIQLVTAGSVETKVRSEFESVGINQTIHRIYLEIECYANILTPYRVVEEKITNEVLLIENVVVGLVPSTYYNLEGMDRDKVVDVIE